MVSGPDRSRAGAAALAAIAAALLCAPARADDQTGTPVPPAVASLPPSELPPGAPPSTVVVGPVSSRPRIEVALGMGASIDDAGLRAAGLSAIPSFYATGGFGDGTFGVDLGVFANSAIGRYRTPNVPVDRLGFDAMLVVRPFADFFLDDSYHMRVLRTLAADLGLGYERATRIERASEVVNRFGARVGVHFDLPLTPAGARSELRLRFIGRRFVSASNAAFPEGDTVPDSRGELFGALAAVF